MKEETEQEIMAQIEERFEALRRLMAGRVNPSSDRTVAAEQIKLRVAEYFRISERDITGDSRLAHIVWPRMVAGCILREMLQMSFQDVASVLEYKDHESVRHACRAVSDRCKTNASDRLHVSDLRKEIRLRWPDSLFEPVAKGDFKI